MDCITPGYEPHAQLEERIESYLKGQGFFVDSLTYHDRLPEEVVRILQYRNTPTALYLRGKADRIAIHPKYEIEFEWETKTHENSKYRDLTIECLPLVFHILRSPLGVRCLYACAIPHISKEFGFWIHEFPPVREIHIPSRWELDTREWFKAIFRVHFPTVFIRDVRWNRRFSGDPYLIIDKSELTNCSHWHELIDGLLPHHTIRQIPSQKETVSQPEFAF